MSKEEQGMRLYQAVERLCMQAGTDTDETVEWLCGKDGGMFMLFQSYFSPKAPNSEPLANQSETSGSPVQRKPLTDEELEAIAEQYVTNCYFDTLKFARAIEAAYGIGE